MEVVWNGSMEREAAERERITPTDQERPQGIQARVLVLLKSRGEQTLPELAAAIGRDQSVVYSALWHWRRSGQVEVSDRTMRTARGRTAQYYRAV